MTTDRQFDDEADAMFVDKAREAMRPVVSSSEPAVPSVHTATTEDAARVLSGHVWSALLGGCFGGVCDWRGGDAEDERERHAMHVAQALAAAGLLATARPDTTTEWGVRLPSDGAVAHYDGAVVASWAAAQYAGATVVRREVGAWTEADRG